MKTFFEDLLKTFFIVFIAYWLVYLRMDYLGIFDMGNPTYRVMFIVVSFYLSTLSLMVWLYLKQKQNK